MPIALRFVLVANLAGLALAWVGPATGAPVGSPCKLVTTADVRAAFGGTVGVGTIDNSIPGQPSCHYAVRGSNLGLTGTAVVFLTPEQTPTTFALAKKVVPGAVAVTGVGASAFYNPHTTAVELLKGTTVANAQAIFLNPGGPQPNAARVKADTIVLARAVARNI